MLFKEREQGDRECQGENKPWDSQKRTKGGMGREKFVDNGGEWFVYTLGRCGMQHCTFKT